VTKIETAERLLKTTLEASFGQDLFGVMSFGPRWDDGKQTQMLGVVLDKSVTPDWKIRDLPKSVGGVELRVMQAGPAEW
jgi:hypothetical protein